MFRSSYYVKIVSEMWGSGGEVKVAYLPAW